MTMSPSTSPASVPPDLATPLPRVVVHGTLADLNSAVVFLALQTRLGSPRKLKLSRGPSLVSGHYCQMPGVIIAFRKRTVAVATSHETVIHAHAIGGRMIRYEARAHSVTTFNVGGAGIKASFRVWTTAMCGPIKTTSLSAELAESSYGQLAYSSCAKWCTPVSQSGKLVCNHCDRRFRNEADLWRHGRVPFKVKSLQRRFPKTPLFRGCPPQHLSQGSIASIAGARSAERAVQRCFLR